MSKNRQDLNPVRLRSTRDFREIYHKGTKISGRYFLLFLCPRENGVVRFGVTATKRLGNAVVRNRAKRIMRHAIREVVGMIDGGLDLIMVARPKLKTSHMPVVKAQLVNKLQQHGYLAKPFEE